MRRARCIFFLLILGFVPCSLTAEPPERRFVLRGFGSLVSPASGSVTSAAIDDAAATTDFSLDDGEGLGLSLEYRLSKRIGLEGMMLFSDLDGMLVLRSAGESSTAVDSVGVEIFTLGVNYHLTPDARAQVYIGARAGFLYNEDATFRFPDRSEILRFDDDNVWEAHVGLLYPLGSSRWLLSVEASYMRALFEGEVAGQDLDFDPIVWSLGVGYHF